VVEGADSPLRAADRINRHPPDAVFLDAADLPAGQAFIDACRADARWAYTPIAVMSSRDGAAEARRLPAHAYLTKPYGLGALLETVERLVQPTPQPVARIALPAAPRQRAPQAVAARVPPALPASWGSSLPAPRAFNAVPRATNPTPLPVKGRPWWSEPVLWRRAALAVAGAAVGVSLATHAFSSLVETLGIH
jgi:CheY-like chemotaxis protein